MKYKAKKRFGQNFLQDQSIINALINSIQPKDDDLMVEIGPGLGAMTQPLLQSVDHLHVVEIDHDIIKWMQATYPQGKVTIHQSDVLKFDFNKVGQRIRVVGNLPYNISSPILFKLLENTEQIIDMHFMLQKEVVERMVSEPSSSAYGRLSVMLQYKLEMEYLVTVPPDAFNPAPKVESAFVRCVPHKKLPHPAMDEALFAKVVKNAFAQKRKTIRNNLKQMLDDEAFERLAINPQLRAENLPLASFVKISNYLSDHLENK